MDIGPISNATSEQASLGYTVHIFGHSFNLGDRCAYNYPMQVMDGEQYIIIQYRYCPFGCCEDSCCIPMAMKFMMVLSVIMLVALVLALVFNRLRQKYASTDAERKKIFKNLLGQKSKEVKRDIILKEQSLPSPQGDNEKLNATGSYCILVDNAI